MKKLLYSISSALLTGIFLLATSSVMVGQTSPSISVIQPNGGESWVIGTSHLISWTDNLTAPVAIYLSTDGGSTYSTLTSSTSGTTWTWDIPTTQNTSSQCLIKIESTVNSSVSATSAAYFSILAAQPADSNAIIQPNGGESWAVGTSHLISWTNYVTKTAIQLSTDGGKTFTTLTGADSISGSTFTWDIPSSQTLSDSCLIKLVAVHDTSVHVQSDSMFSIVATPSNGSITLLQPTDAGIHWQNGTEHLISWSDNFSDSVKVVLLSADTVYSVLSNATAGSGYAWTVADTVPNDTTFKIAVYNAVDNSIADTSANNFTIDSAGTGSSSAAADTIVLVQPDGGESWAWNTEHLISWWDNFNSPVKVELLKNGSIYSVLANSVDGNGYSWTVPNTIPVDSTYKIRVLSTSDTTVSDTSSAVFSVVAEPLGGEITLIQPNGGDQWALGETHLISWWDNFTNPVKVELFKGSSFLAVLDSNITENRYAWKISSALTADTDYRIKVLSMADTTISDESDSSFTILVHSAGLTMTLAQPNGGEEWAWNEKHLISWSSNFTDPVKVELFYNNVFQSVLDSNNTENRYVWTVPSSLTADTGYQIKVLNMADTTIYDQSDSSFTILAHALNESITLVQPNGGEQWVLGSSHLVSWLDNFEDPVKVELFKDGSFLAVLDSSNSTNSYTWKISSALTADTGYSIKILNTADTTVTAESDSTFSLVAHALNESMTVVQPNGGEEWSRGTEHLISWYNNFDSPVKVELFKNGSFLSVLDSNNTEHRYAWTVPSDLVADTGYQVKVLNMADTTIYDFSDSSFTVLAHPAEVMTLVQPNGGEEWAYNTEHLISWSANFVDTVKIELYRAGVLYSVLDSNVTDNRYAWTIGDTVPIDTTYKIKIINMADTTVSDTSNAAFSVVQFVPGGEIRVIQPNLASIKWARGTEHLISWTDNLTEPVDIDLFNTVDSSVRVIAHGVSGSTYGWDIPDTLAVSDNYKVRVTSSLQPTVSDLSDTTFSITAYVPGGTVSVIQPNRGERWQVGTAHLISWTDNLTEPVNIYLIDTIAADTSLIASNVEGSTYGWEISDTLASGSQYKIEVASSMQSISDVSDSTFTLTKFAPDEALTVEQPNGGECWTPNSVNLISWGSNFVDTVKVELFHGSAFYTVLANNVTGNNYAWTVSDTLPFDSTYQIKILNVSDTTVYDMSDSTFCITNAPSGGQITVVQPNGGETWYQGTAYYISWTGNLAELNGDNYDIFLEHYDGSNVLDNVDTIAINVQPSTYVWTVPSNQLADTNYRIKITGHILTGIADSSDSRFTIAAPVKISMQAGISAYPNPSTNFITVEVNEPTDNATYLVTVYNRYGTRIWQGSLDSQYSNKIRLATYDLPNGIYFVTLTDGPKQMSRIFVVQH